jgi:hypothetical protein
VVVEGKSHFDTELFHDDFACAVGEAPTFIVKLFKRLPRKLKISASDLMYARKFITKESCA